MKLRMIIIELACAIVIMGCEDPIIRPYTGDPYNGPATIELRGDRSNIRMEYRAPADSSVQVWITAIVRNSQGVAMEGIEITFSTKPTAILILPIIHKTNENGLVISRLLLHVPPDTTICTLEAKAGIVSKRLALILIGE